MSQEKPTLLSGFLQAGFPAPGDDLEGTPLDTNELLVRNPAATFFMRVAGQSMRDAGIFEGDIVVVDRSATAKNGSIVVAVLNGSYTLKKIKLTKNQAPKLVPANSEFSDTTMQENDELLVWGVVTFVIRNVA